MIKFKVNENHVVEHIFSYNYILVTYIIEHIEFLDQLSENKSNYNLIKIYKLFGYSWCIF